MLSIIVINIDFREKSKTTYILVDCFNAKVEFVFKMFFYDFIIYTAYDKNALLKLYKEANNKPLT